MNQSVGGVVLLSTNTEQMQVTVPAAGLFVAFTTTVPFGRVDINSQSGALVEMIDDVNIADRAGLAASDHAVDAGIAILGINPLDSRFSTDDQSSFLSTGGANFGNSRDVWWTYTPGTSGVLSAAV